MTKSVSEHSLPELVEALKVAYKPDLDTISEGIAVVRKELETDRKAVKDLSGRVDTMEDILGKHQADMAQIKTAETQSVAEVAKTIFP